jgi:D-alanyl-D-alanine carboxypeptidase
MEKVPLPAVSAEMWCVMDVESREIVHGKLPYQKREVASLTKMMTFYASFKLMQVFHEDELDAVQIRVPKYCTYVSGTSACLLANDVFTLKQLWYAMLLPSGNDAALVIADYFGGLL